MDLSLCISCEDGEWWCCLNTSKFPWAAAAQGVKTFFKKVLIKRNQKKQTFLCYCGFSLANLVHFSCRLDPLKPGITTCWMLNRWCGPVLMRIWGAAPCSWQPEGGKKDISWIAPLPGDTEFTYGLKLLIRANLPDHYSSKKGLIFRMFWRFFP